MNAGKEKFLDVVDKTPLVSIDLIIKNDKGEVLLGLRRNAPARDYWFVPGGRITKKDKNLAAAFDRICTAELGMRIPFDRATLLGCFDHQYKNDNFLDQPGVDTYYVALAVEVTADIECSRLYEIADDQHARWDYFSIDEILREDAAPGRKVHNNVKRYFAGRDATCLYPKGVKSTDPRK